MALGARENVEEHEMGSSELTVGYPLLRRPGTKTLRNPPTFLRQAALPAF